MIFTRVFCSAPAAPYFAIGTFVLQVLGARWKMFIGALVLLAGAVVSQLMVPETTGLELNEAARLSNTGELPAVTG
jgi:hypothetical protein